MGFDNQCQLGNDCTESLSNSIVKRQIIFKLFKTYFRDFFKEKCFTAPPSKLSVAFNDTIDHTTR